MTVMKHPCLSYLWLDYKEKHPDGYQLSQLYKFYKKFLSVNFGQEKVSMPVERIPGERIYIDWFGDQPELLTGPEAVEIKKVHIFTTTLGFNSKMYAEVFPDEKIITSFITGVVHALKFYGTVPKYLVQDTPQKNNRHEAFQGRDHTQFSIFRP